MTGIYDMYTAKFSIKDKEANGCNVDKRYNVTLFLRITSDHNSSGDFLFIIFSTKSLPILACVAGGIVRVRAVEFVCA